METPTGYAEILEAYGDPAPYILQDGHISPAWERKILTPILLPEEIRLGWDRWDDERKLWLPQHVSRIRCHTKVAESLRAVFADIHDAGRWGRIRTFDGCYAWRVKRRGRRLSTHAFGIALDFDAATNQMGTPGDIDPGIVEVFEAHGWEWGGRWDHLDPMHFQKAHGF